MLALYLRVYSVEQAVTRPYICKLLCKRQAEAGKDNPRAKWLGKRENKTANDNRQCRLNETLHGVGADKRQCGKDTEKGSAGISAVPATPVALHLQPCYKAVVYTYDEKTEKENP